MASSWPLLGVLVLFGVAWAFVQAWLAARSTSEEREDFKRLLGEAMQRARKPGHNGRAKGDEG